MIELLKAVRSTGVLLLSVLLAATASAQVSASRGMFDQGGEWIHVDYARFPSEQEGKLRLEIYYKLFNSQLAFSPADGGYLADYEVSLSVADKKGRIYGSADKDIRILVATEKKARSRDDFRINQANFLVEPGKYVLKIYLRNRASQAVQSRKIKLNLKAFDSREPSLSDIELAHDRQSAKGKTHVFNKVDMMVVPSVTGIFGGQHGDKLMFYVEIYQGTNETKDVTVETLIRRKSRGMVYRDTVSTEIAEPITRQFREISLKEFVPGNYTIEITLRGRRNKKLSRVKKNFEVGWTKRGMLLHDYKTAVSQISLIATPSELSALKDVETIEDRIKAFDEFWWSRDPSPGSEDNEFKVAFYRRIQVANRNFTHMRRSGWKTARGRIYIIYGEPDQIDDVSMAANSYPYQRWHYYTKGRYRQFTFVDVNDDGDYELQYPFDGLGRRPDF